MPPPITLTFKWFIIYITGKWPLPIMYPFTIPNYSFYWMILLHISQENDISPMCEHSGIRMNYHTHHRKMAVAHYVCALMNQQTFLPFERFITYFIRKWPLLTVWSLTSPQSTLATQQLTTHYTGKWATQTRDVLKKGCIDVPSDHSPLRVTLHTSQENGHISLCMRWCSFRILLILNDLLHTLQEYGYAPQCVLCWSSMVVLWSNDLSSCMNSSFTLFYYRKGKTLSTALNKTE
jgi:hypothetical protein